MAIIKYKDKNGNLQPLGATGDHSHSLESLGAAAEKHSHDVASIENNTNGFMSVEDKQEIVDLHDTVFGNVDEKIVGLVEKIGTDSVSAQISTAVANMVTKDGDKVLSDNNYTDDDKDKLGKIAPGAEVNQNAFTTITVDKTKIEANAKTDNITLTAGDNITFTPDTTSKTVTIAAADTTYKEATKDNAGLMSATDKAKLDTVTEGATKVVVDDALNDASANAIQNKVVTDEINDINTKFTNLVGTDSVSSQISNALNALTYAGSKDVGGSAISAEALTSKSVGDTAQPVYFNANGKPVACGHTINADVPEGAKFTDTTYSAGDGIALSDDNKFSNSGVRSVVSGDNNGTIKVNTNGTEVEVSVTGLGSAAYTSADAYDKAKAAEAALESAKAHTDKKFTDLVGTTKVSEQISDALSSLKYAVSSDVGGAATSANKVNQSLTVKLNNGTTANTNYFTFDGSSAKTINITPSSIGAATTSTFNGSTSTTPAAGLVPAPTKGTTGKFLSCDGSWATPTNTKNTAGTTSTTNTKLYLVGATSQGNTSAPTAQTYTNSGLYIDNSNNLYSNSKKVSVEGHNHDDIYYTDDEIDTMFSNKVGTDSVSSQISTAISNHSHKYAGSSTAGGAADEAKKVSNSLVVKLNNGTTANTDYFTFNGSSAKTINITPSSIGAAASSHGNHVPTTETANNAKFLRNDNTWQTVTPGNIGALTATTISRGNFNDIKNPGIYALYATSQNAPTDTGYWTLIVGTSSNQTGNYVHQIAICECTCDMYIRYKAESTWCDWRSINPGSASTSKAGIVQLSDSTSSTSTSKAATPNSVKSAYDLANGKTAVKLNGSNSVSSTASFYAPTTVGTSGYFLKSNGSGAPSWVQAPQSYTLPIASSTTLGGVKVGSGLSISDGVLSATGGGVSSANPTFTGYLNLNSNGTPAQYASTLGYGNTASGQCANASGNATVAGGYASITGGVDAVALGNSSSAIGQKTTAYGNQSHAEGKSSQSAYKYHSLTSVSAGQGVYNIWNDNFNKSTAFSAAAGTASHVEGMDCLAWSDYSHAEGLSNKAEGVASHAEGQYNKIDGACSHVEGAYNKAQGYCQHVQGHFNSAKNGCSSLVSQDGTAFIIGNGTSSTAPSNAFRVDYNGTVYSKSTYMSTGADYAEYFEWQDSNPDAEDRRGYFVTLDGEQIKIAEPNDYILGIISGQPAVIGNGDEDWRGRYILDEFGAFIPEEFEYEEEIHETVIDEETGEARVETKTVTKTGIKYKENPDYDSSRPYIQRADRPEWDAVGMMGVLSVRDDGTCQVNGYCKVAEGGIATASESGYRVIKRINDHIVKVVFR